jgi:hypothetical protein
VQELAVGIRRLFALASAEATNFVATEMGLIAREFIPVVLGSLTSPPARKIVKSLDRFKDTAI